MDITLSNINDKLKEHASHVMQEFTLTYPCGCSYVIGKHYTGHRFCDIHNEVIVGVSKYFQNE